MLRPQREALESADLDTLSFETVGTGTPSVILLHGLFGCPGNFRAVMEALADSYRFYALQLPINPHENRQHKTFHSIGQLTEYVERFVNEMNLDSTVLCGNSLGGQIAVDFCLRNPGRADGLVLAGSAGLFERNVTKGKGLRLSHSLIREQAREVFHDSVHVTDQLVEDVYSMLEDRQYRRFLLKVSKATRDRDLRDELPLVEVPTLIIWGRNDSITPPFVAEHFHEEMPCAKLVFIDECGHAPPLEQPVEFARLLHEFIGRLSTT